MAFRFMPWLRFLRLPNVLTVPGDLLAAAVLAGHAPASALPVLPSVCLAYLFGMAFNDSVDVSRDRDERPERPLPSGAISLAAARGVALLLAVAAALTNAGFPVLFLLSTIVAYTLLKNPIPLAGPPLMAACRGLSLWIGGGSPGSVPLPLALGIAFWMFYILGVTALAARETHSESKTMIPMGLTLLTALGILLGLGAFSGSVPVGAAAIPAALLLMGLLHIQNRIRKAGTVRPSDIGSYLALLFPLQAFVLCLAGHFGIAVLIIAAFPVMTLLRRRIPAS